jgi:hypothetical protein
MSEPTPGDIYAALAFERAYAERPVAPRDTYEWELIEALRQAVDLLRHPISWTHDGLGPDARPVVNPEIRVWLRKFDGKPS